MQLVFIILHTNSYHPAFLSCLHFIAWQYFHECSHSFLIVPFHLFLRIHAIFFWFSYNHRTLTAQHCIPRMLTTLAILDNSLFLIFNLADKNRIQKTAFISPTQLKSTCSMLKKTPTPHQPLFSFYFFSQIMGTDTFRHVSQVLEVKKNKKNRYFPKIIFNMIHSSNIPCSFKKLTFHVSST